MCEKEISLLNIITNLVGSLIIVRKKNKSYSFKHNYVIYVILSQALFNLHLSFPFLHSKQSKQSPLRLLQSLLRLLRLLRLPKSLHHVDPAYCWNYCVLPFNKTTQTLLKRVSAKSKNAST